MDADARAKLEAKLERPEHPLAEDILATSVDTVTWLRDTMWSSDYSMSDDPLTGSSFESKPPMQLTAISQADKEAAALGYWCDRFGIVVTSPVWRNQAGVIKGVYPSHPVRPVEEMVARLLSWLRHNTPDSDWVADEWWGLWTVRQQSMRMFPALGVYLSRDDAVKKVIEDRQEALF